MAKHYDNLEDVKSKLAGTIIYYENVPVYVKQAITDEENGSFILQVTNSLTARNTKYVKLDDPLLNWTRYHLGYCNMKWGSVWWYRKPLRQYRQGLKSDQMKYAVSSQAFDHGYEFGATQAVEAMLIDRYPNVHEIEQTLKDFEVPVVAFHKDFALSWDKIHKDMILEHKGRLIGCMSNRLTDVKLADEYEHLTETVKEVIRVY